MTDKYYISYYSIQDSYLTEEQIKDGCLGQEWEKLTFLDVAFDSYCKGIHCNLDCGILRASLEMGVGDKVELPSPLSFEIVQWCKSSVINCYRGTCWDNLVEAIFIEVICGLENPD